MDYSVTKKKFGFAAKRNLPFEFASAADGTNVVKIFEDAIKLALQFKKNPDEDFYEQALQIADSIKD